MLRRTGGEQRAAAERDKPLEVGALIVDPGRRIATQDGKELELTRKEFELLELLLREAGSVITRERLLDEVWDVNWFGSTKTLDVRIRACDASWAMTRRHRASVRTVRGVGLPLRRSDSEQPQTGVTLRARLLLAFAYVLVLVIVALEVPLALNLARRVDAEIKSEAQGQAHCSPPAPRDDSTRRPLDRLVTAPHGTSGAEVIVVDDQGTLIADSSAESADPEASYASRPEIARALAGRPSQGTRRSESLDEELLFTAVPVVVEGRRAGAVSLTQSVDAVRSEVRNDVIALIGVGVVALLSASPWRGISPARWPSRCATSPARLDGSRAATSMRERRSKDRRNSGR